MSGHNVLITGGAGFIGSKLASELHGRGYEVFLVDSLHPQVHRGGWPDQLDASVTKFPFDVTVATQWDALFKMIRPQVIVHLAAETGTGQSLSEATRHSHVNVVGTTEMLDGLTRAGFVPEHLVLASSRAVYGEGLWITPDETRHYALPRGLQQLQHSQWQPILLGVSNEHAMPAAHRANQVEPRPTSIYAATKLSQEHILGAWATAKGAGLTTIRFQNVYGPGQSLSNPYTGVVSLFAQRARAKESIPVYEDGEIVRDFVFIEDAVSALASACALRSTSVQTVDVGTGVAITLLQLATEIARQASAPAPTITGEFRLGDVRAAFADITEANALLNYEPRVTLSEGISHLLAWIDANEGDSSSE